MNTENIKPMKNKILIHFCLLTLILATSSCTPTPAVPTPLPVVANTPTPTFILYPTSTQTPENTPTPIRTPPKQCIPISFEQPVNNLFSGSLVISGYEDTPTYLLDLASWQLRPLIDDQEDKRTLLESVSPDHKWVAFKEFDSDTIVIQSLLEEDIIRIPIENGWPLDWLDDQHLWIGFYNSETKTELLLNPFTRERTELQSSFPNQRTPGGVGLDWFTTIYNSTLTRLVYPTFLQEIILWDTQEEKAITTLYSHPIINSEAPVWSPDGDQVVIRVLSSGDHKSELLLVSQDGEIKSLFKPDDSGIVGDSGFFMMTDFSWSPDESQIAFWLREPLKEENNTEKRLAVINIETQDINVYCIYGFPNAFSEPIFWSSSGDSLALALSYKLIEDKFKLSPTIILFDFEKAYLFPIEDDFRLAGWLE